jgi:hypothetical protein
MISGLLIGPLAIASLINAGPGAGLALMLLFMVPTSSLGLRWLIQNLIESDAYGGRRLKRPGSM